MRKVIFVTGTRADYGKIKPLIRALEEHQGFIPYVYVCGMHLIERFGETYREVLKDGYEHVHVAHELELSSNASEAFGNTVKSLASFVEDVRPDMIVVHGDRMDALAGAVVGALNNVLVAHIEGGELSGTIDESIRHAISKFAHIHFTCNEEARRRLLQLGEEPERIFVVGSADIDVMLGDDLPSLEAVKDRYEIDFENYGILMYHPVTTEVAGLKDRISEVVTAVLESGMNFVVVYPNNDLGSDVILEEYDRFRDQPQIRLFPSIRFEFFLTLLENAEFILGNSSAGVRESGVYGVPGIDVGTRQQGRYEVADLGNLQHVSENAQEIKAAIGKRGEHCVAVSLYGKGNSTEEFVNALESDALWKLSVQKRFLDRKMAGF